MVMASFDNFNSIHVKDVALKKTIFLLNFIEFTIHFTYIVIV